MAEWKKVGEFQGDPTLEIYAMKGVVIGRDRHTTSETSTSVAANRVSVSTSTYNDDRLWVQTPSGEEHDVDMGTNTNVAVRESHEVTVWYVGTATPEKFVMAAFENNTTQSIYDFTERVKWCTNKPNNAEYLVAFLVVWFLVSVFGPPLLGPVEHLFVTLAWWVLYCGIRFGARLRTGRRAIFRLIEGELRAKV